MSALTLPCPVLGHLMQLCMPNLQCLPLTGLLQPFKCHRTVFQLLFRCKTRESIWQLGDSHWPQVAAWFLSTWIRLTWLLNTILVSMSYKLETTFSLAYKSQYTMQDQTKHSFLPTQMQYKSISMFLNYVCIYISIANANNKTQETPNCAKTWINFPCLPPPLGY